MFLFIYSLISLITLFDCESITQSVSNIEDNTNSNDLFNCPDPGYINYLETNETLTRYIDYRPGCSRQWVLRREGFNDENLSQLDDNQLIKVSSGALLIITYLDLDTSSGDYLLIADGIPSETYRPSVQVIITNIEDESKTINIQSPITWIGLVHGTSLRSSIGLIFTWVPPELTIIDESIPSELRSASIDLCFEQIECSTISEWKKLIRSSLTDTINNYLSESGYIDDDGDNQIKLIDSKQLKIIRNESRIADEKTLQYKYCRVQIAVTSQPDIYWAHPQLTKSLLTTIWLTDYSNQSIVINQNETLKYKICEDETFDASIVITSISVFVIGLITCLSLWRWNHSYLQSIKKTIKPPIGPSTVGLSIIPNGNIKHNPIYESEEEDEIDYVLGGKG